MMMMKFCNILDIYMQPQSCTDKHLIISLHVMLNIIVYTYMFKSLTRNNLQVYITSLNIKNINIVIKL